MSRKVVQIADKTWTANSLAQLFELDRRTVIGRLKNVKPVSQRTLKGGSVERRYKLKDVLPFLADPKSEPHTNGERSLEAERKRLIREQADREALENARTRGEVIPVEQVEQIFTATIALVVNRLEGVASRLANELVNIDNPAVIREKLLIEHRAIRKAIADGLGDLEVLAAESAKPDDD